MCLLCENKEIIDDSAPRIECENLTNISGVSSKVYEIHFTNCINLTNIDLSKLPNLNALSLFNSPIKRINLHARLKHLILKQCGLPILPDLTYLSRLQELIITESKIEILPELPRYLMHLILYDNNLTEFPVSGFDNLISLNLNNSNKLKHIKVPNKLRQFKCSKCPYLETILFNVHHLTTLEMDNCPKLKFSDTPDSLVYLSFTPRCQEDIEIITYGITRVSITDCDLKYINFECLMQDFLECLIFTRCLNLTRVSNIPNSVSNINLEFCPKLHEIQLPINNTLLTVNGCESLDIKDHNEEKENGRENEKERPWNMLSPRVEYISFINCGIKTFHNINMYPLLYFISYTYCCKLIDKNNVVTPEFRRRVILSQLTWVECKPENMSKLHTLQTKFKNIVYKRKNKVRQLLNNYITSDVNNIILKY